MGQTMSRNTLALGPLLAGWILGAAAGCGDDAPETLFFTTYGSGQIGSAIVADPQGGVLVAASPKPFGTVDLLAIDASGELLSQRPAIGESISGMVLDAAGNLYVTGCTSSQSLQPVSAFVAKLDASAKLLWTVPTKSSSSSCGWHIALGTSKVYVSGYFSGKLDLGTKSLVSAGADDVFLAEIGTDGKLAAAISFGGAGSEQAGGLVLDDQGNLYTTGVFAGSVSLGTQTLTASGQTDIFVAKLLPSLELEWAVGLGGTGMEYAYRLVRTPRGDLVVGGLFFDQAQIGGTTLSSPGATGLLVKLDDQGSPLWSKVAGANVNGLSLDSDGGLVVSGQTLDGGRFDGKEISTDGRSDAYVMKLSPSDELLWVAHHGEADQSLYVYGHAVDPSGQTFVTGTFGSYELYLWKVASRP
jgi:hypothetical protein